MRYSGFVQGPSGVRGFGAIAGWIQSVLRQGDHILPSFGNLLPSRLRRPGSVWPAGMRDLTGGGVCLTLMLAIGVIANPFTAALSQEQPNVLLVAVDDLNDWVGCLGGHPQGMTPNIDALARRGTLFSNAHCQGPICGPSRASLLSGRYPHSTGVYQQTRKKLLEADPKNFRGQLLPEYFARHGYQTLAVGKITHTYAPGVAFDLFGGKFELFGPKPARRFHYHLPDVPFTGTQTDWGAYPDVDEKMPDHKSVQWAVEQLDREFDRPFFMAVGFVRPHVPFYVPEKWFKEFPVDKVVLPPIQPSDLNDVPATGRAVHEMPAYPDLGYLTADDNRQFRLAVQAYLACMRFVDAQVGRLLDALEASNYADNTIVVLFSDHGYHLGEKDRVSKHSLWEESTRVPLIVVPLGEPAVRQVDHPVGLIDIYPTLIELCRLPGNPRNEGRSLVPLLGGAAAEAAEVHWRDAILTTYAKGCHSLRSRTHRLIRYEDGSLELYDHRTDPNEWLNVAGQDASAAVIEQLSAGFPEFEADYHPAVRSDPVNAWFEDHFRRHGVD